MGQRGLCFWVAEVGAGQWGQPAAWAPFAKLNKGAFFQRGLRGSTARLEMKPPTSEADGGRMGGSSRGQEKRRRRGCAGAPGELPLGDLQRRDLGIVMPPDPGCPDALAGGCWVPRTDARPPSASHDATTMAVVPPVHPASQATLNFAKYFCFGSEMLKNTPWKGESGHIDSR